jgi:small subunit ribosomal protein S13
MVYILNTEIPDKKALNTGLKMIFGINSKKASEVCSYFGISRKAKIKLLTNEMKNKIVLYIENNIIIGDDLKQSLIQTKENQIRIKSYKGIRTKFRLPRRGQRTHTNAKTVKRSN